MIALIAALAAIVGFTPCRALSHRGTSQVCRHRPPHIKPLRCQCAHHDPVGIDRVVRAMPRTALTAWASVRLLGAMTRPAYLQARWVRAAI